MSDPVAPSASASQQVLASALTPSPGKSALYVFRPYNFVGSALMLSIFADNQNAGSLTANTYVRAELEPGKHSISVIIVGDSVPPGTVFPPLETFESSPGQVSFYMLKFGLGKTKCVPISQDEALTLMKSYQLTRPASD